MIPRNDPCWCGSGRKFKACHLRQPQAATLLDRARWLYAKGIVYALESGWASLVEILSEIRTAGIASEEVAHEVVNDGLVLDVALFEGGVFAEYLAARGHLLPADELLLAQQWLLTQRSAYEVIEVEAGVSATFRDLRTGDAITAADSVASQTLTPGHLVCCHLLPQPDGDHAIHSIGPIGLHERSELCSCWMRTRSIRSSWSRSSAAIWPHPPWSTRRAIPDPVRRAADEHRPGGAERRARREIRAGRRRRRRVFLGRSARGGGDGDHPRGTHADR